MERELFGCLFYERADQRGFGGPNGGSHRFFGHDYGVGHDNRERGDALFLACVDRFYRERVFIGGKRVDERLGEGDFDIREVFVLLIGMFAHDAFRFKFADEAFLGREEIDR